MLHAFWRLHFHNLALVKHMWLGCSNSSSYVGFTKFLKHLFWLQISKCFRAITTPGRFILESSELEMVPRMSISTSHAWFNSKWLAAWAYPLATRGLTRNLLWGYFISKCFTLTASLSSAKSPISHSAPSLVRRREKQQSYNCLIVLLIWFPTVAILLSICRRRILLPPPSSGMAVRYTTLLKIFFTLNTMFWHAANVCCICCVCISDIGEDFGFMIYMRRFSDVV
jgi:hypothetical protein